LTQIGASGALPRLVQTHQNALLGTMLNCLRAFKFALGGLALIGVGALERKAIIGGSL